MERAFTLLAIQTILFISTILNGCSEDRFEVKPDRATMKLFYQSLGGEGGSVTPPTPSAEFNLMLIGQSNAYGRNEAGDNQPADLLPDGITSPSDYWDLDAWSTMVADPNIQSSETGYGGWGVEKRIIKELLDNSITQKVNLLKLTDGGTGFYTTPFAWKVCQTTDCRLYKYTVREAIQSGKNYNAVVWIQGETDATDQTWANEYQQNLTDFINALDSEFTFDKFVIVRLFDFPAASQVYASEIQAAQDAVALAFPNKVIIVTPSPTLTVNDDDIHFDSAGIDALGFQIYNAIKGL